VFLCFITVFGKEDSDESGSKPEESDSRVGSMYAGLRTYRTVTPAENFRPALMRIFW